MRASTGNKKRTQNVSEYMPELLLFVTAHQPSRVLVHGQVTIIFVVSVCLSVYLFVCLFVQSFSQPSLIRFRSNKDTCYMSGSSCVP